MEHTELKKSKLSLQIDLSKFTELSEEEKMVADVIPESRSFFRDGIRRLLHNPLAVISLVVLVFIIANLFIVSLVSPYHYSDSIEVNGVRDVTAKNMAPFTYSDNEKKAMENGEKIFPHIFGTDELCRDYYTRVVAGTAISLIIGVVASALVLLIGMIYGSIAGYLGGKVDLIMMRIVDVIYSLPDMLMIILLSVVVTPVLSNVKTGIVADLGVNMVSLFLVFGLFYWVGMARLVRGQILSIRNQEYIMAARLIRTPRRRIIRKHIIPNCMSVIFVAAALQIPAAIFTESYLSFVGLGVQAPMPSLGALANAARQGMVSYPYKLIFPALMISLIVLSFNLLGDGLRDAFDPKLRK